MRDAIDTETLCRERNLAKDQIMLDLQVLLANLHDWVRTHYLAPDWQQLELNTATELIYRKPGRVTWGPETIEVTLDPYRYPEQQQTMEATCCRFNAARLCWRDGRLLIIKVTPASYSNYAVVRFRFELMLEFVSTPEKVSAYYRCSGVGLVEQLYLYLRAFGN